MVSNLERAAVVDIWDPANGFVTTVADGVLELSTTAEDDAWLGEAIASSHARTINSRTFTTQSEETMCQQTTDGQRRCRAWRQTVAKSRRPISNLAKELVQGKPRSSSTS